MTLLESPSILTVAGAIVVQAILTWATVRNHDRRIEVLEKCINESREWRAANGQRITDIGRDIEELRRKVFNGAAR